MLCREQAWYIASSHSEITRAGSCSSFLNVQKKYSLKYFLNQYVHIIQFLRLLNNQTI